MTPAECGEWQTLSRRGDGLIKIAYICQSYPPMVSGAAGVVQRLARGMAARGHDVLVIASSDQKRAYVERSKRIKLVRLRSMPNPLRVGQRFCLWSRRDISAALWSFRPDLVHLHDPVCVGLSGLRAAQAFHLPVVLTVHQLPWSTNRYLPPLPGLRQAVKALLWRYAGWFARQCHVIVVPSQTAGDVVCAHIGCDPQVISNGVDVARFTPSPAFPDEREVLCRKYGLDPALPVILHVGRIDVDKQVDLVVRAAAVAMRTVDAQLLVVGDGTRRAAVTQLCEMLGMAERCHFPGFVSAEGDLPGLYRLASVFVLASELETQGIVALEAAATGLPVVAVRAAAVPDAVSDGVNGYLVAPGDVEAMAERLMTVLRDPESAVRMGRAGRAMAEQHALDGTLGAHEQLYWALLASPEPGLHEMQRGATVKRLLDPITQSARRRMWRTER
jgi:glycosyltransferase involved in cell wall biosynthesis